MNRMSLVLVWTFMVLGGSSVFAQKIYRVGDPEVVAPVFTKRVPPIYPKRAAHLGVQGNVLLEALLGKDGSVGEITVLRPLAGGRAGFEDAAVEAVKQWVYQPGTVAGKPTAVRMVLSIDFVLFDGAKQNLKQWDIQGEKKKAYPPCVVVAKVDEGLDLGVRVELDAESRVVDFSFDQPGAKSTTVSRERVEAALRAYSFQTALAGKQPVPSSLEFNLVLPGLFGKRTSALPEESMCLAWANKMAETLAVGDYRFFDERINKDGLLKNTFEIMDIKGQESLEGKWRQFAEGFSEGMAAGSFGESVLAQTMQDGDIHFLRLMDIEGRRTALFRLSGNGLNYMRFYLHQDEMGILRFDDFFFFTTGELFSATVGRLALTLLTQKQGVMDTLLGKNTQKDLLVSLKKIAELNKTGQYQQVITLYEDLPKALKDERIIQIHRYQAASELDEKTLREVCIDQLKRFEKDPSMYLLLLDGLLLTKQYERMLVCIDGLDKQVGGDPYLNLYRSQAALEQGRPEQAKAFAQKMTEDESCRFDGYSTLIHMAVTADKHDEALAHLTNAWDQDVLFDFRPLVDDPEYRGFLASEAYKKWAEEHPITYE